VVSELTLKPQSSLAPHTNPNLTYLLVIEGGGFVQVEDERARVAAGDAVVMPPDAVRSAWTELTPMRAIVVEFAPLEMVPAGTETHLLEGGWVAPGTAGATESAAAGAAESERARPTEPASSRGSAGAATERTPSREQAGGAIGTKPGGAPLRADGGLVPGPAEVPPDHVSSEREPW
jgi:Cupin domain